MSDVNSNSVSVPRNVLSHPLYLELTMQEAVYLEGILKTYVPKLKKDEQMIRLTSVMDRLSKILYDINQYVVIPF